MVVVQLDGFLQLKLANSAYYPPPARATINMMSRALIDLDPWLEPYQQMIEARTHYITDKSNKLLGKKSVGDFALGHLFFGLHQTKTGWVLREWAPNATKIFLVSEMTDWQDHDKYQLQRQDNGVWQIQLPKNALKHKQLYKLHVHWDGGGGYRIPAYANYVVQDEETHGFDAAVWSPAKNYIWKNKAPESTEDPLLIYEAHVGMSSEKPEVASYEHFTKNVLPRIAKAGYNAIQLMAIQEHPYYGSFGYHVSNFFAASSRFGTPDDLKKLIDTAHGLGLKVILDIVHSHAVRNEEEGLSKFDGTLTQYFYPGERGNHELWDSRVFDYGKNEVLHFLLSNVRFWLDEYQFDGFRFDGTTSMIYTHHGLGKDFSDYGDYFGDDVDKDAITYLTLANRLVQEVKPGAITIAEEMSGFPGIAGPLSHGGHGFTHRLSMGVPDIWIKTIKEKSDESWKLSELFHELITHRPEEKVISYAESHDQALVGDQTLIFRLIERDIYDHMQVNDKHLGVERGIALHKLIRLITASLHGGGYLSFMGNEFGHPEWIDFPREGNNWSYHYARRQWSLADDPKLKFHQLGAFDQAMIRVIQKIDGSTDYININDGDHVVSFVRSGYLFAFNFSPNKSYVDYGVPAPSGHYKIVLSSDDNKYGGQDRIDHEAPYLTDRDQLKLYLPARTAVVLKLK